MELWKLAEDFIRHGVYLRAWSPKTVRTYRQGLNAFQLAIGERTGQDSLTKAHTNRLVISLRERGLAAGGCNMYIRTPNSYLTSLAAEWHAPERLRIKLLPDPREPLTVFSQADVRLIMAFKPKGRLQLRTWTLLVCLLDTGVRIEEALGLERKNVDFDNLILRVLGKGNKERLVPMSLELRKHLFRLTSKSNERFVFHTSSGLKLTYRNAYRDVKVVGAKMGIEGPHVHPHSLRHFFAVTFIRNGGDVYRLSRILGHAQISTAQIYLRSMGIEHLQEGHSQYSPLSKGA